MDYDDNTVLYRIVLTNEYKINLSVIRWIQQITSSHIFESSERFLSDYTKTVINRYNLS